MLAFLRRLLGLGPKSPVTRIEEEPQPFEGMPLEELLARFDALPQGASLGEVPYRESVSYRHPDPCPSCPALWGAVQHRLIDPRKPTQTPLSVSEKDVHRAREHGRPLPRDAAEFLAALATRPMPPRSPPTNWIPPTLPECDDAQYLDVEGLHEAGPCAPVLHENSSWCGIAVNGPKAVTLPSRSAPQRSFTAQAVVSVMTRVPSHLTQQLERLVLVFEDVESGERRQNAVNALTQVNGISVSPAMTQYPGGRTAPITVTQALLRQEAAGGSTSCTWARPNISLLSFPEQHRRYRCWVELDEVHSNVIEMEIGHQAPSAAFSHRRPENP